MNPPAQPVDFPHPPQASELGRPRRPPGPPSPARIRRRQEEDRGDRSRPAGAPIPKACTTPPPTGPAAKPAAARLSGWEAIALPFVARGRFRVVGTLGGAGLGGARGGGEAPAFAGARGRGPGEPWLTLVQRKGDGQDCPSCRTGSRPGARPPASRRAGFTPPICARRPGARSIMGLESAGVNPGLPALDAATGWISGR